MAYLKHVNILIEGPEFWNEWREKNPGTKPMLGGADLVGRLREPNLSGADLSGADLEEAYLSGVDLRRSNLGGAKLSRVKLDGADLSGVNLNGVDLSGANLSRANLSGANLDGADLGGANLGGADLSGADLSGANLFEASLDDTNLRKAILRGASLGSVEASDTDLSGADLSEADLGEASFDAACFKGALLEHANARWSRLIRCDLTEAKVTGIKLYGSARDDWIIDGVECRYVCWDDDGEQRCPKERDFEPREFERLYKTLPTIEYVFENGMSPMDPLIMDRVVEAIRGQNPEFDIRVDSISARGLAPSVKFTVLLEEYKEAALAKIRSEYEAKLIEVEAERDKYWGAITRALDAPKEVKLIAAGPGSIVATDGSTVSIEQHIHNAVELQRAIDEQPEDSGTFAKVAKRTALGVVGDALKDVAKGQIKEAAKQIVELGKDLGPVIVNTAAYAFFKGYIG